MATSEEAKAWLAHAIETDELAHTGVLGMHWGVRKEEKYQAQQAQELADYKKISSSYTSRYTGMPKSKLRAERARIQSEINKMDMNKVVGGLGSYAIRSKANKAAIKRGDKTAYQKLSAVQKSNVEAKTSHSMFRKSTAKSIARGAAETALILGGSALLISKMGLKPQTLRQGQIAIAGLGVLMASIKASEISASAAALKYSDLGTQRKEIDRELAKQGE